MNIPNYLDHKFVDEDGYLTEPWKHILNQLINELQTRMSEEGHIVPQQSAANISLLNTTRYKGGLLYDTDNDKLNVNINGVNKEVLTT